MTTRTSIVSLLCLAAAACGGKSNGNAAASKQFNYGSSSPASSTQMDALDGSLSSVTTLQSAPDVASAASFTEFSGVTDSLVGSYAFGLAPEAVQVQKRALVAARSAALYSPTDYGTSFDNPACVTVTATSVKLSGCTITRSEGSGSETITVKVNADGSVTLTDSNQTLTWDLTMALSVSASSGSGSGSFHAAGKVTVQAPTATADGTIKGSMTNEISMSGSGGGQSVSLEVDEALDIDVTYETSPSTCVTGGTLEAKRVFADWSIPNTSRPADKGAKITWQSCGNATIQLSTN
jgi:hypothetical protein